MRSFSRIAEDLLRNLAEWFEALETSIPEDFLAGADPRLSLISIFLLSSSIAFSSGILIPLFGFSFAVLLAGSKWKRCLGISLLGGTFTFVVSIPMMFTKSGQSIFSLVLGPVKLELTDVGLIEAFSLVLRTIASIAILSSWMQVVGLDSILRGLRAFKVPSYLILSLRTMIRYIPIQMRDLADLLLVRDARSLRSEGYYGSWSWISTALAELTLRGFDRIFKAEMVLRSKLLLDYEVPYIGNFNRRANLIVLILLSCFMLVRYLLLRC